MSATIAINAIASRSDIVHGIYREAVPRQKRQPGSLPLSDEEIQAPSIVIDQRMRPECGVGFHQLRTSVRATVARGTPLGRRFRE